MKYVSTIWEQVDHNSIQSWWSLFWPLVPLLATPQRLSFNGKKHLTVTLLLYMQSLHVTRMQQILCV